MAEEKKKAGIMEAKELVDELLEDVENEATNLAGRLVRAYAVATARLKSPLMGDAVAHKLLTIAIHQLTDNFINFYNIGQMAIILDSQLEKHGKDSEEAKETARAIIDYIAGNMNLPLMIEQDFKPLVEIIRLVLKDDIAEEITKYIRDTYMADVKRFFEIDDDKEVF